MRDAREAMVLTATGRFCSGGPDPKGVPTFSAAEQKAFLRVVNRSIGELYACPIRPGGSRQRSRDRGEQAADMRNERVLEVR